MKISVRQICFILLCYNAVSKMLLYPTVLSHYCGRDLLFVALIDFAVQAVVVWAVSFLCSRTDKTFFQLLEGTFGNIFARIIYGLFALFFIAATIVPLCEQKLYVHTIFYDTVPPLLIFLPFFFFSIYAAGKKFTNIGRSADVCMPIFVLSMIFVFSMSVLEIKWNSFMPVLKTPVKDLFGGALGTVFRFAEPCYVLMFMGHFKYKKGDAAKMTFSYIGGALTVLLFLFTFYGIYGDIAQSRQFAVSKISLFFPAIDTIGRIDLIALYILEIVMLFALVLNVQLALHCIMQCTGYQNRVVLSLAVNAVLIILLMVFDHGFNNLHTFYAKWMWIAFAVFANAIPVLAWTLRRKER